MAADSALKLIKTPGHVGQGNRAGAVGANGAQAGGPGNAGSAIQFFT